MQSEKTSPVDFSNTEVAFRDHSNASLRQAYQLFSVMNSKTLVGIGKQLVNMAFAIHFPVEGILRKTNLPSFRGGSLH